MLKVGSIDPKKTVSRHFKSGCQRKPRKMLKMSTKGGQRNKFIITSWIGQVEYWTNITNISSSLLCIRDTSITLFDPDRQGKSRTRAEKFGNNIRFYDSLLLLNFGAGKVFALAIRHWLIWTILPNSVWALSMTTTNNCRVSFIHFNFAFTTEQVFRYTYI